MKLEGDRMVCEWHAAEFACRTGERLSGPARPGSRLIVLPTSVEDGTLQYEYGSSTDAAAAPAEPDDRS
jgi:nitrite reductase/ring-hydroxylating ferredoxin subunit